MVRSRLDDHGYGWHYTLRTMILDIAEACSEEM